MFCVKCNTEKDCCEFYPAQKSECKECVKKRVKKNRNDKIDYYKQYDKDRYQNDPKVKERHKKYQKTKSGKESIRKSREKWIKNNKVKRKAHIVVGNAIRDGKLIKPDKCEMCLNKASRIEGHHENYEKPLEVTWLCKSCHVEVHRNDKNR